MSLPSSTYGVNVPRGQLVLGELPIGVEDACKPAMCLYHKSTNVDALMVQRRVEVYSSMRPE